MISADRSHWKTIVNYTYDADGRATSKGNISYTYDVDGNVKTESDGPNENNASRITYSYYPDGKREYLSVQGQTQGEGLNQNQLFSYSYRTDGSLLKQAVNWVSSGTFVWNYTPMGREVSETDPLQGNQVTTTYWTTLNQKVTKTHTFGIKSYDYDGFGRIQSLVYPQGYRADSMVYDQDDELWGFSYSEEQHNGDNTKDGAGRNFVLTTRGDLLSGRGCTDGTECAGLDYAQSANGTLVDIAGQASGTNAAQSFDARSGMTWTNLYRNGFGPGASGGTNTYVYDSSGRQITDSLSTPNGQYYQGTSTYTRTYDPENHLVQAPTGDACNPNNFSGGSCYYTTANLSYGADGQLRGVCQNPTNNGQTCASNIDLHWDGTTLLFTGTGTGPGTLYIGKLATMGSGGGLTVADRNQNGIAESWHSTAANGTSGYGPWLNYSYSIAAQGRLGFPVDGQTNWGSCGGVAGACPSFPDPPTAMDGLTIDYSRADGYGYGPYAVQGARSYDSTSQQWLTPDAYGGNVHNPMSQKPFVWNENNPLEYSDPSGYAVNQQPLFTDAQAFPEDAEVAETQDTPGDVVDETGISNHVAALDVTPPEEQTELPASSSSADDENGGDETKTDASGGRYFRAQERDLENRRGLPAGAPKMTRDPKSLQHMFDPTKPGHVGDSPLNRINIRMAAAAGRVYQTLENGTVRRELASPAGGRWWATVNRQGIILNGGYDKARLMLGP